MVFPAAPVESACVGDIKAISSSEASQNERRKMRTFKGFFPSINMATVLCSRAHPILGQVPQVTANDYKQGGTSEPVYMDAGPKVTDFKMTGAKITGKRYGIVSGIWNGYNTLKE